MTNKLCVDVEPLFERVMCASLVQWVCHRQWQSDRHISLSVHWLKKTHCAILNKNALSCLSVCHSFARHTEKNASIRESLTIKANDVDRLSQLEPVLNWKRFSIPIPCQRLTILLYRLGINGLAHVSVSLPVFCLTRHRTVRGLLATLAPKLSCKVNICQKESPHNPKQRAACDKLSGIIEKKLSRVVIIPYLCHKII